MRLNALTRWDPFGDVLSLQDRLSRTFGDQIARVAAGLDSPAPWYPPVDIHEEDERLVLRAELPGVAKEDIDIELENGTLTLRGEKKQEKSTDGSGVYRVERYYGGFARSFVLPTSIKPNAIKATFKDGVLEVVLPKADEARATKIKVGA